MRVVLDANVVASEVCWDGEAYLCLVTYDRDLLILGKPFGIEIVKPAGFLRLLPG